MTDRILVVDDEQIIRESISFILQKEGYTVREADNGRAAYDKLVLEPFDLVITNLEMPEMKGIELLERTIQMNPQTSVIIITAYGDLERQQLQLCAPGQEITFLSPSSLMSCR